METDEALIIMEITTSPRILHYACCRVARTFSGVTTAFCGESVLPDQIAKPGELSGCQACVALLTRNGCPLGRWCEVED